MTEELKQKIIEFNKKFGINTEFVTNKNVFGYVLNKTIYINENEIQDYEQINKHELLHFFEDTPEFEEIKQKLLKENKENLPQIRNEYELRYFGLYSEEEIKTGVLDNEIVIDMMSNNLNFEYENGLKIGENLLGEIEKSIENKRYMTLTYSANIKNLNLSEWEKIFVANYYNGKNKDLPQKDKINGIKSDINSYLKELYEIPKEKMIINPHSPEVIRHFESEIKALQARGEDTSRLEENKERGYEEIAIQIGNRLYEEYKHIVDLMKGLEYESAFKCMMLRETLTKTYKIDKDEYENKEKTIVKKRDLNKSLAGHMIFNETTLDFIYKNITNLDDFDKNFSNLYFASVAVFKNKVVEKSEITLDGVETFDKGTWMKFDGKTSDAKGYVANAKELSALVQDTPWCTKELASSQLLDGDFYVFVDNENKPHIAVKMIGNTIDEVRGTQNGNAQELEEEYRDVAISFLENNKEIENGLDWLEKEEWNKRLIEYAKKIDNNGFTKEDMPQFIKDYFRNDYRSHGGENSNKIKIQEKLAKIKFVLAEYYECTEEEIFLGDFDYYEESVDEISYKVIFGNATFSDVKIENLECLERIEGNANFKNAKIKNLGNLKYILGYADFYGAEIGDLRSLKSIEGDLYFDGYLNENINVENIKEKLNVKGKIFLCYSSYNIEELSSEKLKEIIEWDRRLINYVKKIDNNELTKEDMPQFIEDYFKRYYNRNPNKIKVVEKIMPVLAEYYECTEEEIFLGDFNYSEKRLEKIPYKVIFGNANFEKAEIKDLGNLKIIVRNANFHKAKIENFEGLESIEGDLYFDGYFNGKLNINGKFFLYYNYIHDIKKEISFEEFKKIKEWNKRLSNYVKKIDNNEFTKEDIPQFIEDYLRSYNKGYNKENLNIIKIQEKLENIKWVLAEYYECTEEEIFFGDFSYSEKRLEKTLYKVIFGDAYFFSAETRDLGNLKYILGDAYFFSAEIGNLGNLKYILGNAYFDRAKIEDLGSLERIEGSVNFEYAQIGNLESLERIVGDVKFNKELNIEKINENLNIQGRFFWSDGFDLVGTSFKIFKEIIDWNRKLSNYVKKIDNNEFTKEDVPQFIEEYARNDYGKGYKENSNKTKIKEKREKIMPVLAEYYECTEEEIFLGKFNYYEEKLDNITYKVILGDAYFSNAQIENLGSIKIIEGNAYLNDSKIKDLGNLENIGKNLYLGENINFEKINENLNIQGKIYFDDYANEDLIEISFEEFKEKVEENMRRNQKDKNSLVRAVVEELSLEDKQKGAEFLNELMNEKEINDVEQDDTN